MKVLDYIKQNGLESLNKDFGINVKLYEEGLIVLNYDQIESPKNDITNECRSLILDKEFNVVSRSFDRFFNYGENFATFDPKKATAFEKVDGSLIKIYNYGGVWYVATRGTAFAESGVNGWDITFKDMVFKALEVSGEDDFQLKANHWFSKDFTYIFEVTGVENRVVTRYQGYSLYLLATRQNQTGDYYDPFSPFNRDGFKIKAPKQFKFDSIEACLETAKHLPDLQEGYVMYEGGVPVCKVKSPAYVAVHHIRGEGLSPKRIAELVVINEQEEYLNYFEEDREHFTPYVEALDNTLTLAQDVYNKAKDCETQKEFALWVKDYSFAFILFQAKRNKEDDVLKVFNSFEKNAKVKFMLSLMGEKSE